MYPASLRISSAESLDDLAIAFISFLSPGLSVSWAICIAIFSAFALFSATLFIAAITASSFFCCGGYSTGTMLIAPLGQASAHTPHPMHFSVSIMLFSVSVAPFGQTYRQRQSFVQSLRFLTAILFIPVLLIQPSRTSSQEPCRQGISLEAHRLYRQIRRCCRPILLYSQGMTRLRLCTGQ